LASGRSLRVCRLAAPTPLSAELPNPEAFRICVEEYNPDDPSNEEFSEGPPPKGFRNLEECIRPYHENPDWHIWPEGVGTFERDQKVIATYTLATNLFIDCNKVLREGNEDGMRRMARMIWEIREVCRFEVDKICKPNGRKCKPWVGNVLRGLELPKDEVKAVADLYKEGTEFVWPAFTSCQEENDENSGGSGLWPFDGNLNFEIEYDIDVTKTDEKEVLAPVAIKRFIGGSQEVLFPPGTKFKVVGERPMEKVTESEKEKEIYTKLLKVVELPKATGAPGERRR